MVLQSQPIEYDFPQTEATDVTGHLSANGHNIYYLDNSNRPQSVFIERRFWEDALTRFEDTVEHSLIIRHSLAKINY